MEKCGGSGCNAVLTFHSCVNFHYFSHGFLKDFAFFVQLFEKLQNFERFLQTFSLLFFHAQSCASTILKDFSISAAGHPSEARAFDKLRRYHTRTLRFIRGPKNIHFGKTHFRDPNIDARIC